MSNSTEEKGFIPVSPITFKSRASGETTKLKPEDIIKVTANANLYLYSLKPMFADIGFDVFEGLGQRNLSGFVGEVFVRSFHKVIKNYAYNPHADGRPDLLDLTTRDSTAYYQDKCFALNADKSTSPVRSFLAPFKYGGFEVKSSIGSPVSGYKELLKKEQGISGFSVGMPRINYLQSITYWGHHASCENLIGLYYDYVPEVDCAPQILAIMHSELDPETDWNEVSVGKEGSKKTSNTSLTMSGKDKIYSNVVTTINDDVYLKKLQKIGLKY